MVGTPGGNGVIAFCCIVAHVAGSNSAEHGTHDWLFAKRPRPPDCHPSKAPHAHIDWGNMNGHGSSFQAWRSTANSVDLRFLLFPEGYKEGQPWGPNCPWPIKFICVVRSVSDRPSVADFQKDGKGPGLGSQDCSFAQATAQKNGQPRHCHVYMYNLEGSAYLDIQYHAWCMACIGPACSQSTEDMIYPKPETHVLKTREDYDTVMSATTGDISLSGGDTIRGYTMDDGCRCWISRTITGYRNGSKGHVVRVLNKKQIPNWHKGMELVLDDGLPFKTVGYHEHEEHIHGCTQVLVACFALIMYILWGLFGLQRYFFVLHETGLATLIGYIIGGFKILIAQDFEYVEFTFETMSFVVLPIVIFAAGFNFKKKSLFKYGIYIFLYGFIGTLVVFFGLYTVFQLADSFPEGSFPSSKPGVDFVWDVKTCLILAAVLSCCDTVAPLTLINPKTLPVLYAIVFGEAVINDVVGVLLNAEVHRWIQAPGIGELAWNTSVMLFGSLVFGLVCGLLISLLWAKSATLQQSVLQPVLLMMLLNYLCYAMVELLELSAIFAVFVSALVSSHYAAFSLNHEARHFANEASEMLAFLCESAMFVYFGYASATYLSDSVRFPICVRAVLYCVGAVVILRPLVLTLITNVMQLSLGCQKLIVSYPTIFVFEFSGCIRGVISYALILKHMPSFEYRTDHQHTLVSTVLLVVNFTTMFFGCLLPILIKCLEPRSAAATTNGHQTEEAGVVEAELASRASSATTNTFVEGEEGSRIAPQITGNTLNENPSFGFYRTSTPLANISDHHLHTHPAHRHSIWHVIGHNWKEFDNKYLTPWLVKTNWEHDHSHSANLP